MAGKVLWMHTLSRYIGYSQGNKCPRSTDKSALYILSGDHSSRATNIPCDTVACAAFAATQVMGASKEVRPKFKLVTQDARKVICCIV